VGYSATWASKTSMNGVWPSIPSWIFEESRAELNLNPSERVYAHSFLLNYSIIGQVLIVAHTAEVSWDSGRVGSVCH
jgi:hypothetical protein